MNAPSGAELVFTRVIAAVDASSPNAETVNRAVDLASRLGIEVAGLFIEDINLFRIAGLPMVRHLTIGSAVASPLTAEQLEADMRQVAARAASELEAAAARRGIKWSFRVVRGLPSAELTAATMSEDLLVVGGGREVHGLPLRLDSPLRNAVRGVSRSILLAGLRTRLSRPLAVMRGGAPLRTLAAATRFTEAEGRDMAALIVGPPADTAQTAALVEAAFSAKGYRSRLYQLTALTPTQLVRAMREGGHDLLVLPADLALPDHGLEDLMREASCDVLVVR